MDIAPCSLSLVRDPHNIGLPGVYRTHRCRPGASHKCRPSAFQHPSNEIFTLSTLRKKDITDLLALLLATPVLAIWSLVSFFPFFQLFARERSVVDLIAQGVFLATGALGITVLWTGVYYLMRPEPRASLALREKRRSTLLWLAVFAAAWLVSYAGYSVS